MEKDSTDPYKTIRLHRVDVERIKKTMDATPNGLSFTVWGKAMAELSAEEVYALVIRTGRRRIREMEDRIREMEALEEKKK